MNKIKDFFINPHRNIIHLEDFKEFAEAILSSETVLSMNKYCHHINTNTLHHSIAVAYYSFKFAKTFKIKCDLKSLVRGALLHDYYLYDWRDRLKEHNLHGFRHPRRAMINAVKDFSLNPKEQNIILRHMFPLVPIPPKTIERPCGRCPFSDK
ncbi:MAG: phosphohydrolase [Oscillospiraceae bacterium]|nr:phosphohydrolase [Oscillospiraceae bacterium]